MRHPLLLSSAASVEIKLISLELAMFCLFACLFVCLFTVCCAAATVVRTSTVKVLEREREYVCSRCKKAFMVEADFEQFYTLPKPER